MPVRPPSRARSRHEARTEAHAHAVLDSFAQRVPANAACPSSSTAAATETDATIAEVADMVQTDLILMVTHGRGLFGEMLRFAPRT